MEHATILLRALQRGIWARTRVFIEKSDALEWASSATGMDEEAHFFLHKKKWA